jgi:hypothetical protein
MSDEHLDNLFAAARRSPDSDPGRAPMGFADRVLQKRQARIQENRAFVRASILSISASLIVLGAAFGLGSGAASSDDSESTAELAYALWDPTGN